MNNYFPKHHSNNHLSTGIKMLVPFCQSKRFLTKNNIFGPNIDVVKNEPELPDEGGLLHLKMETTVL